MNADEFAKAVRCGDFRLRADRVVVSAGMVRFRGSTKAWASSATAKAMQAHFLCLAHNLMILCEGELGRVHGVRNEAETVALQVNDARERRPPPRAPVRHRNGVSPPACVPKALR